MNETIDVMFDDTNRTKSNKKGHDFSRLSMLQIARNDFILPLNIEVICSNNGGTTRELSLPCKS